MRISRVFLLVLSTALLGATEQAAQPGDDVAKAFFAKLNEGKSAEAEALARAFLAREAAANRMESPEMQRALDLMLEIFIYRAERSTPEIDELGQRALALREKLQGPDSLATAQTLRLWATAQLGLGNYSSARTLVDRSVKIFESAERASYPFTRADYAQYSRAVFSMAGILTFMRDWHGGKRALLKSIDLKMKVSSISPGLGTAYLNLGRLEHYMQNHKEALVQFRAAREHFTSQLKESDPLFADVDAAQAYCEYEDGNKAGGLAMLERALAVREKIHGANDPTIAGTIDNLAELYRNEGRFSDAVRLMERAVAINRNAYGRLHPQVAENEAHLAQLLAEKGDTQSSFEHAMEADRIAREHLSISVPTLPEREATLFALKRVEALGYAIGAAVELKGDTVAPVYDSLIRARALVFDELALRHRVQGSSSEDSELITRLGEELRGARERLARLAISKAGKEDALQKALEERDSMDRRLAAASVEYRRRMMGKSAGLKEVLAALPESTVLVSYRRFFRTVKGVRGQRSDYSAFVLTKSGPVVLALGSADEINEAVEQVRAKLAVEAAAPGVALKRNEAAYRVAADKLRKLVWDPIDRYVAGAKRVFIVPDGPLHTINFAALPEAGVEGRYLIERGALFHYLSAERDLVNEGTLDAAGTGLLAVGNPSFNRTELARGKGPGRDAEMVAANRAPVFRGARSNCSALQTRQYADLPSSAMEVDSIARLWKRGAGGDVIELTGELAGPDRFKAMAPGRRTIHLAVHGFAAGTDCNDALSNENPLLLTGLALAGANRRGEAGEDGILTAEEIASLDLRGVEWAVLSACETGLGMTTPSEGVFGLQRAFQLAGAHTVIMSLWPVEDKVTSEWMQSLYEQRLTKKMDTASSVRTASLETLKRRRLAGQGTHPFYWAPFVAVGDWR